MSADTLRGIEDAIRAHFLDGLDEEDTDALKSAVVIDWVAGFTISNIVDVDGRHVVGYSNGYTSSDTNPNSQAHLAHWVGDQISYILDPSNDD